MDLLDLAIVLLVIGAAASGLRRGLSWVGLSLLGLLVGVLVGVLVSAPIARRLGGHSAGNEALIGTGLFFAIVAVIQGVGTGVGYRMRIATMRTRLATLDSGAGAALAVLGTLLGAWFLGFTFADSPSARIDQQIQGSAVLRRLDDLLPRPPGFLLQLRQLLHDPAFGNPFSGLGQPDISPVPIPADADTPGIRTAAGSVVKVLSEGCGLEAGSGWALGPDEIVTNAHVVAGGQNVGIDLPGSSDTLPATVVLVDPEVDVAVLRVPGAHLHPLTLGADPARGVQGAVIGYPHGGPQSVVPAAVRGTERAQGEDIYGGATVTRDIEVLGAVVVPGNSGGPVVDRNGTVIGLVFAASTTDPGEGYALSPSQITADLQAAAGRTAGADTGACTAG